MNPDPTKAALDAQALNTGERTRYLAILTALQGLAAGLPAEIQPMFEDVKSKINATLTQLPPLEMVAGAIEAKGIFDYVQYAYQRWNDSMQEISGLVGKLASKLEGSVTAPALCGKIDEAIAARLAAGDLVLKATHLALLGQSRADAEKDFGVRQGIRTTRKAAIGGAGLLVPTAEEALDGDETVFNGRLDTAKVRTEEIRQATGATGELPIGFTGLVWGDEAQYRGQLEVAKMGATAARSKTSATAASDARRPDPLIGGGGANAGSGTAKSDRVL